jgi:hypothetical protein
MKNGIRQVLLLSIVLVASAAVCNRPQNGERSDGIPLTANSYLPADYRLTSELYRKWLVAQENLNREVGSADRVLSTSRISVTQPSPARISAVVTRLEQNQRTRRAIESAGLSVRDYVLTTVALYQALNPPPRPTIAQLDSRNLDFVDRHRDEILRLRNTSDFQIAQCDDSEVDSDAHAHCDGEDCDEVHWVGNDSDGDAEHDHDDFDGDEEEFDGDEGDFDDEDVDSDD